MITILRQQQGLVSGLAIMTMIFAGICLAGLMPFLSTLQKKNVAKNDVLQAQYAAEAGAKRALTTMGEVVNKETRDWSWLNSDRNMITSGTAQYNVAIFQENGANTGNFNKAFNTTEQDELKNKKTIRYRITSVGKFQGTQVTVYAIVSVNSTGVDYTQIIWSKYNESENLDSTGVKYDWKK